MEIKINLKVGKRSSNNPFLLEMITIKVHPKIHSFLKQCCSVYENKVLNLMSTWLRDLVGGGGKKSKNVLTLMLIYDSRLPVL